MTSIIKIFILLFLLVSQVNAATFYIKNGGNDTLDGLSDSTAWENIDKIRTSVTSGDTVYLNRGDTWQDAATADYGAIHITNKNTITIGAYGTGDRPIVSCTGQTDPVPNDDLSDFNAIELQYPHYDIIIEDIWFQGGTDTMAARIQNDNVAYTTTFNRCRFGGVGQPSFQHAVVNVYGSGKTDFNNCMFSTLDTFNLYKYTQQIQYKVGGYGNVIGCEFEGIVPNVVRIVQYDPASGLVMYWDNNYLHTPDLRDGGSSKGFKIRSAFNQTEFTGATFVIRNNVVDWTGSGGMIESDTASMETATLPFLYPTVYYYNNTVVSDGEGMFTQCDSNATINIYNNICYNLGYGNNNVDAPHSFRNNVFYSTPNIYDGTPGVDENNVTTDPNIADPTMATVEGAMLTVSCINSINTGFGTAGVSYIPLTDYSGTSRTDPVDRGAYEFTSVTAPSVDVGGSVITTDSTYPITGTATATTGRTITGVTLPGYTVIPDDGAWDEQIEPFSVTVNLSIGLNTFNFTATDSSAEQGFAEKQITRNAVPIGTVSVVKGAAIKGARVK